MTDRIGRRVVRLAAALLSCLVLGGLLAGCGPSPVVPPSALLPSAVAPPPAPIPKVCVFEVCRVRQGTLEYAILMPARWNGTLLLYVPGFYRVYPVPAGIPVVAIPSPRTTVTRTMIARGYAVVGATYAWGGWSVTQSMRAAEQAYAWVSAKVGKPRRVYAWGQSMGALASTLLAQRHPDWVSGTASACGVLGGTSRFFDSALDVAYAVRSLLLPALPIDRFPTYAAAAAAFLHGRQAITRAEHGSLAEQAKLVLIADLVHAPTGIRGGPPPDPRVRVNAAAQLVTSALGFGTVTRWDLARQVGGAPSGNAGLDYGTRIDGAERDALDRMSPGVVEAAMRALAAGRRVSADPAARARVTGQLSPSGQLTAPMVTLHDAQDQVAPLEHEGAFGAQVAAAGRGEDLLQLVTAPPANWTYTEPATYGVGHCRFSDDELIGLVTALDDWVSTGLRPTAGDIRYDFGEHNGLDLGYKIPSWPGAR